MSETRGSVLSKAEKKEATEEKQEQGAEGGRKNMRTRPKSRIRWQIRTVSAMPVSQGRLRAARPLTASSPTPNKTLTRKHFVLFTFFACLNSFNPQLWEAGISPSLFTGETRELWHNADWEHPPWL